MAALDQVLSLTRAHVIIVSPPPLPGRPELARTYARIAKRTGLRKGLPVADLVSEVKERIESARKIWRGLFG